MKDKETEQPIWIKNRNAAVAAAAERQPELLRRAEKVVPRRKKSDAAERRGAGRPRRSSEASTGGRVSGGSVMSAVSGSSAGSVGSDPTPRLPPRLPPSYTAPADSGPSAPVDTGLPVAPRVPTDTILPSPLSTSPVRGSPIATSPVRIEMVSDDSAPPPYQIIVENDSNVTRHIQQVNAALDGVPVDPQRACVEFPPGQVIQCFFEPGHIWGRRDTLDFAFTEECAQATIPAPRRKTFANIVKRDASEPLDFDELLAARPHHNAYFSVQQFAWFVCAPLPDVSLPFFPEREVEVFFLESTPSLSYAAAGVAPPIPAAHPAGLTRWGYVDVPVDMSLVGHAKGVYSVGKSGHTGADLQPQEPTHIPHAAGAWAKPLLPHTGRSRTPTPPGPPEPPYPEAYAFTNGLVKIEGTFGHQAAVTHGTMYPATIPTRLLAEFLGSRHADYAVLAFVWRILDTVLFRTKDPSRDTKLSMISLTSNAFRNTIGWDDTARALFVDCWGFSLSEDDPDATSKGAKLRFPDVSRHAPLNRKRIIRAWLELGIYIEHLRTPALDAQFGPDRAPRRIVNIQSALPAIVAALHGRPNVTAPKAWGSRIDYSGFESELQYLGVTKDTDDDTIAGAFNAQVRLNPYAAPIYLSSLFAIAQMTGSQYLTAIARDAESRIKPYTALKDAFATLHCEGGFEMTDDDINTLFSEEIDVVRHALADAVTLSDIPEEQERRKKECVTKLSSVKAALIVIAEWRNSEYLKAVAESTDSMIQEAMEPPAMTVARAKEILGCGEMTDDTTLVTLYQVRVADSPHSEPSLKEALKVIGTEINSPYITAFLETGSAEAAAVQVEVQRQEIDNTQTEDPELEEIKLDFLKSTPVGLSNIANTCYLNSILQYFFIIKPLRDKILTVSNEQDLIDLGEESIRVGGRLVSHEEIVRSKRFILLLKELYDQLIHAKAKSVTPKTELAYLALVPPNNDVDLAQKPAPAATSVLDDDIVVDEPAYTAPSRKALENTDGALATENDALGDDNMSVTAELGESDAATSLSVDELTMIDDSIDVADPARGADKAVDSVDMVAVEGETQSTKDITDPVNAQPAQSSEKTTRPTADSVTSPAVSDVPSPADASMRDSPIVSDTALLASPTSPDGTLKSVLGKRSVDDTDLVSLSTAMTQAEAMSDKLRAGGRLLLMAPPAPETSVVQDEAKREEEALERAMSTYMDFGRQNDVAECMDNIMFQMECVLNDSEEFIKGLFYGKMKQTLDVPGEDVARIREEPFFSLVVDVATEGKNLYEGLDTVFDRTVVEIDGKEAQRTMTLSEAPPLLQIQLQRVQYDREQQQIYKCNAHLQFDDQIALDRYLDSTSDRYYTAAELPALKAAQERSLELLQTREACRSRIAAISAEVNVEVVRRADSSEIELITDIDHMYHHMETHKQTLAQVSQPGDEPLEAKVATIDHLIAKAKAEAEAVRSEYRDALTTFNAANDEYAQLWSRHQKVRYRLVTVFIHRGTATSGHYFLVSKNVDRDPLKESSWIMYNDSNITHLSPEDARVGIFEPNPTSPNVNPSILIYCREDLLPDMIEPIKREIAE